MKRSATLLRHGRVSELSRRKHRGKETAVRANAPPLIQPEVKAEQGGKVTGSAGPPPLHTCSCLVTWPTDSDQLSVLEQKLSKEKRE